MNADDQMRKELIGKIAALPEDVRHAFGCLIMNYDTITAICKANVLSEEESRRIIRLAQQRDDPMLLLLALFERRINSPSTP